MTRTTRATAAAAALALPGVASAETAPYSPAMSLTGPCVENRDTSGTQYDVLLCAVADVDQSARAWRATATRTAARRRC